MFVLLQEKVHNVVVQYSTIMMLQFVLSFLLSWFSVILDEGNKSILFLIYIILHVVTSHWKYITA
jgi:hypothetical protein